MPNSEITIRISGREANLILEYGYPFPEQAEILQPISKGKGRQVVAIDQYWLELIVGDLCRSIKEAGDFELQQELDSLCDSLEFAIRSGAEPHVV